MTCTKVVYDDLDQTAHVAFRRTKATLLNYDFRSSESAISHFLHAQVQDYARKNHGPGAVRECARENHDEPLGPLLDSAQTASVPRGPFAMAETINPPAVRGFVRLSFLLLSGFMAGTTFAQDHSLAWRLAHSVAWEENLFRLPDGADDPHLGRGLSGKSDRLATTTGTLTFDKPFSQQRLLAAVAKTYTTYQKFSFLDRESLSYRSELQWALTPKFTGSARIDRTVTPVAFEDTQDVEPNDLIMTNRSFSVAFAPVGGLRLFGGVSRNGQAYARPLAAQADSTSTGAEFGMSYAARSGNTVSLLSSLQRGSFGVGSGAGSALSGDFEGERTEISGTWRATGRSSANARLAHVARRHQAVPERDFSGYAWHIGHSWSLTNRFGLTSSLRRDLSSFIQDVRSSYRVDDSLAVAASFQATEKLSFGAGVSRQRSVFKGPVAGMPELARRDVLRGLNISAQWSPIRAISIGLTLRRDRRSSPEERTTYNATTASVDATLSF